MLLFILSHFQCLAFVFVNDVQYRFLTNAVGHELKSVRSKKHLWLSINMTDYHGEAKRLGRDSSKDYIYDIIISCLSCLNQQGELKDNGPHNQALPLLRFSVFL